MKLVSIKNFAWGACSCKIMTIKISWHAPWLLKNQRKHPQKINRCFMALTSMVNLSFIVSGKPNNCVEDVVLWLCLSTHFVMEHSSVKGTNYLIFWTEGMLGQNAKCVLFENKIRATGGTNYSIFQEEKINVVQTI